MDSQNIEKKKRICDKCGYENNEGVSRCIKCNSTKFAPSWVLAKIPITRQTCIEVTLSNPKFGYPQKRISLNKWWPNDENRQGGNSTFNINTPQQWEIIKRTIEDLYSAVGWEILNTQINVIEKSIEKNKDATESIEKLVNQYPELFLKIGQVLDSNNIAKLELDTIASVIGSQAEIISKSTSAFRESYITVLNKLPKQHNKAINKLENLLESWTLQQITSVAQAIKTRDRKSVV
jgi:flagellar biosynthesis chaperone FliJ